MTSGTGAAAGRAATRLDEPELRQRLDTELRARGMSLTQLSLLPAAPGGGNSGLTLLGRVREGDTSVQLVVKVAPPGLEPVRNRDVIRQARLLQALHRDGRVPVPEVLLTSPGDPPERPPAVAMRFVDGETFEPGLETRRPPAEVLASMPPPVPSAVCHGDFRLGNMLCNGSEIRAVIDWEIWSRTDPRLDLAWMLWITDSDHPSAVGPVPGMPSKAELVGAYLDAGGRPITPAELAWFDAMTCYKQAATIALLAKHGRRRGDGTAPGFERLTPLMIERAAGTLRGLEHRP